MNFDVTVQNEVALQKIDPYTTDQKFSRTVLFVHQWNLHNIVHAAGEISNFEHRSSMRFVTTGAR